MRNALLLTALAVALTTSVNCAWDQFEQSDAVGGAGGSGGGNGGNTGGDGGNTGGDGGAGGVETGPCGTVDLLANTFDVENDNQIWDINTSNGSLDASGTGVATFSVHTASSAYSELLTRHYHDFRDSSVAIEISEAALTAPAFAYFWVGVNDSDQVRFLMRGTELSITYELANDSHDLDTLTFDPVAHRWWRLREEDGIVYWEVSPDGAAYTVVGQRAVTSLFPMHLVRSSIEVNAGGMIPAVTEDFSVETVAVEGPGNGGWCPVSAISDDFDDGFRGREWFASGGTSGTSALETDGSLHISLRALEESDFQYVSAQNYNFENGSVTVELAHHGGEGTTSFLELTREGQKVALFIGDVDDGNGNLETRIQATTDVDGTLVPRGDVLYEEDKHRFLRIRHDGTGLIWDTSPDGVTWSDDPADGQQIAIASPSPTDLILDSFDVRVGARGGAMGTTGVTRFDNLNVEPAGE